MFVKNNYIESKILKTIIRKATFTYCFSLHDLYYFTYIYNNEPKDYIPYDAEKTFKRYARILNRLCLEECDDGCVYPKDFIGKKKIYDDYMLDSQIELYNILSEFGEYIPIDGILPASLL